MRVVLQRSLNSNVIINKKIVGKINKGLVVLVGFTEGDNEEIIDKMIDKIINLRLFSDSEGKTNLSLADISGEILNISQFTLYGDTRKGRRPSFVSALNYKEASNLYEYMNKRIRSLNFVCETGCFGADMIVNIQNDGPFTIVLDSDELR